MTDAIVLESLLTVFAAPLAGVAFRSRRRLAVAMAGIVAALGAAAWIGSGLVREAVTSVAVTYATLGAAALALAAIGALCRSLFADVLDAAACSLAIAFSAAFGVLLVGRLAGELPPPAVNALLFASPLVATASAADIDILRFELLYQISPIAHRRFDYPIWYWTTAAYGAIAAAGFVMADLMARSRRPNSAYVTRYQPDTETSL